MKHLIFKIDKAQLDILLRPIRSKRDIISLLVETTKLMLVNYQVSEEKSAGEIHLIVSNMSRVFIFSEKKYVSFSFPFNVQVEKDGLFFSSKHVDIIDNRITSFINACVVDDKFFSSSCVYDFISSVSEVLDQEINFWMLMRDLMTYEDGYIRYDHDEEHANGKIHPVHHYDVFYSNNSTFKVGLKDKPAFAKMIDLLKLETDCGYVE